MRATCCRVAASLLCYHYRHCDGHRCPLGPGLRRRVKPCRAEKGNWPLTAEARGEGTAPRKCKLSPQARLYGTGKLCSHSSLASNAGSAMCGKGDQDSAAGTFKISVSSSVIKGRYFFGAQNYLSHSCSDREDSDILHRSWCTGDAKSLLLSPFTYVS